MNPYGARFGTRRHDFSFVSGLGTAVFLQVKNTKNVYCTFFALSCFNHVLLVASRDVSNDPTVSILRTSHYTPQMKHQT